PIDVARLGRGRFGGTRFFTEQPSVLVRVGRRTAALAADEERWPARPQRLHLPRRVGDPRPGLDRRNRPTASRAAKPGVLVVRELASGADPPLRWSALDLPVELL